MAENYGPSARATMSDGTITGESQYYDGEDDAAAPLDDDAYWLQMAQNAYQTSTDFIDSSLRRQWERNLDAFNSKHASGSKYGSDAYKYRSKIYRPKTRSVIKRGESAVAMAFFSTQDAVHVSPSNENDKAQRISAEVNDALLNFRLTQTLPWFKTLLGAYQDAETMGAVVSKQAWRYEVDKAGQIKKDEPEVVLFPLENLRLDPGADWLDPINSSPFLIHMIPMYVGDVKQRMLEDSNKDGAPIWRPLTDGQLMSGLKDDYNTVRMARVGRDKTDPKNTTTAITDFSIVWVHENIMRIDGDDVVYYTLGTQHILSDPVPISDIYLGNERPFVLGSTSIEVHKMIPAGVPEVVEGLQIEANDIANQRLDNVKLVLNRRYFAKRGANIDFRSLTRNVPGSVTQMDDINTEIRSEAPPDVTSSAYAEQDRINVDFDELAGSFSPGSVATNRKLGETVGGMEMMNEGANAMTEYKIRIFAETWVEPVLRQMIKLEQAYETDVAVLAMAGKKAQLYKKYGMVYMMPENLGGDLLARVNVGFGSTNPEKRIKKLSIGLGTIAQYFPQVVAQADVSEIVSEVFGALGYKDGERFFPGLDAEGQDPRIQQLTQQIQQLQQQLQGRQAEKQMDNQAKLQIEQMRQQGGDKDRELDRWQTEVEVQADMQGKVMDINAKRQQGVDDAKTKIGAESMKLRAARQSFVDEAYLKQTQGEKGNYGLEGR